jgi:hypothetical protein
VPRHQPAACSSRSVSLKAQELSAKPDVNVNWQTEALQTWGRRRQRPHRQRSLHGDTGVAQEAGHTRGASWGAPRPKNGSGRGPTLAAIHPLAGADTATAKFSPANSWTPIRETVSFRAHQVDLHDHRRRPGQLELTQSGGTQLQVGAHIGAERRLRPNLSDHRPARWLVSVLVTPNATMNAKLAARAANSNSVSAKSDRMLRSIPTNALTTTSTKNVRAFRQPRTNVVHGQGRSPLTEQRVGEFEAGSRVGLRWGAGVR